ncbi:ADP-ribose pyrophosphatase [Altererythrobacter endophyticus]|uniref:ADP-ribose pyrophosphatase n=2 Tax=Altericroceibacterium endophyticum TaxID=1808508 RepID=A0A6I4TAT0_9SPHN|nr:NUDIX hydrolase [Altericroceibacterium endophyticum]MXO67083.1 ADP-ribose pyrophosphatase [Altericroceibacterium endophyticum]
MPDGAVVERHLLDNGSAAAVLPYDPVRRVALLITQPRAPVIAAGEPPLLEAIAGNLDEMAPDDRIREEAMEEGGVKLSHLQPLTNIWSLAPVSSERIQLYLAEYSLADRTASGGGAPSEHENISVFEIALQDLAMMQQSGTLTDAKTLILVQTLMLREPQLFV